MYDFGDDWQHSIAVEKVLASQPGLKYPVCTGGKRHGPPEDCGGIGGFYSLRDALADPEHDAHEDQLEWLGEGFDPERFSMGEVNQRLGEMFG
jgi:pRiA4b ORF-3-like protein